MNRKEHLLIIAAEECDETSQRIIKALRFGLEETQAGQQLDNADRITYEFSQLYGMMQMLFNEGHLHRMIDFHEVEAKKKKVEEWLLYSKTQGLLDQ